MDGAHGFQGAVGQVLGFVDHQQAACFAHPLDNVGFQHVHRAGGANTQHLGNARQDRAGGGHRRGGGHHPHVGGALLVTGKRGAFANACAAVDHRHGLGHLGKRQGRHHSAGGGRFHPVGGGGHLPL